MDHGTANIGVTGNFVANDDEAQVAINRMVLESGAGHGEGFNQAGYVFLGANGAGVKQKGIANLITLQDAMALASFRVDAVLSGGLARDATAQERRVGSIVDETNAGGRAGD